MQRIIKQAQRLVLWLADIVFPVECLGCGQSGQWLCLSCLQNISWRIIQTCPVCLHPNLWGEYCDHCYQSLDGIMVASSYEDKLLKQAIKDYKYHLAKELAQPLSTSLIVWLGRLLQESSVLKDKAALPKLLEYFNHCLIIPVPLSRRRQAWRGFNQSELLARPLADFFNLDLDCQHLKRIKYSQPQVKLTKQARLINIQKSFVWQGQNLNQRNILLIDDLTTTGATLSECAKVLKRHGAGEVWGLVLAKN
ncbi:MAG: hypothetical protein UT42_C0019G0014 [Candidatus Falkowbacteria bacterium GW2011_GWA2_39_24]|uniref:Double zinc ribbon domain-containing protein n=1 Tax=Candidatus Falkowbacteria bacterium GW2011_GWA2_39_24 TaxID=1618634 RepID=A0A0G0NGZ9_9BACT|nr:MAG: hypothetical protein UT42_C0019G0014 [Candidatus Falkowbacteria bacterium GW2011_GWA2_39_24]